MNPIISNNALLLFLPEGIEQFFPKVGSEENIYELCKYTIFNQNRLLQVCQKHE